MPLQYDDALRILRDVLLEIKPTGDDGFEGLIASVLAAHSGLVIRLAKSGSQFGRDGSSPPASFAIAMEGKRYRDDELRLEVLAGKVFVAAQVLAIDVWVVGTTSAVGDDNFAKLSSWLEEKGITLLCLDWALHPMPPLAVALAAEATSSLAWFAKYSPTTDQTRLSDVFDAVQDHPTFTAQSAALRDQLQASTVGIDALRRQSDRWLRTRLTSPVSSQQSFGQIVQVADAHRPPVIRVLASAQLASALIAPAGRPRVIVVLGEEGTGKTWLVATWWVSEPERPILLLVSGRRASQLVVTDPTESLARLLAEQDHSSDKTHVEAWRRRLERWKTDPLAAHLRFVLVLDGLNEHPSMPWGDLVSRLSRELSALGGVLVTTCRPEFWRRDVVERLGADLDVTTVTLGNYTDSELAAALAPAGISPNELAPGVRDFVRNPRVCGVALRLLESLSVQPDALTIDRLLLEYWRARLQERGDLVVHTISDFEKLLRSHARTWREGPRKRFDRDQWVRHSGVAERRGTEPVESDLSDIEEGRFLQPSAHQAGAYEFRREVLPFALALLINDELLSAHADGESDLDEALDRILAPVRGFDAIADVVAAAVGLGCLAESLPAELREALIRAWFILQNKTDDSIRTISAYLTTRPDAFLDVAEDVRGESSSTRGDTSLSALLLTHRDDPRVRPALIDRIPRWLARWSRRMLPIAADKEHQERRQEQHHARIATNLAALTPSERSLFGRLADEVEQPAVANLERLAVLVMANRALEPFVPALLGWSLVRWVAPNDREARDELAWAVRLNAVDPAEVKAGARALVGAHESAASDVAKNALASLLRLIGDTSSASYAETLSPRGKGERWRRVEKFCDVNPHDPASSSPANLVEAQKVAAAVVPDQLWYHMGTTMADADLRDVTAALARFDPDVIVAAIRRIVATLPDRTGLPLRQAVFQLPDIEPLLNEEGVAAVRATLEKLLKEPTRVSADDLSWVTAVLYSTVRSSLSAEEQCDLLKRLPPGPILTRIVRHLKPLPLETFERIIRDNSTSDDTEALARTLLFAPTSASSLSPDIRTYIVEALFSSDDTLAACAASAIIAVNESDLDSELAARIATRPLEEGPMPFYADNALASMIVRRKRSDLGLHLSPAALGWAARQLGGATLSGFADTIAHTLGRLLKPIDVVPPMGFEITVAVDDDGRKVSRTVRASASEEDEESADEFIRAVNDPEAHARAEDTAHRALVGRARAYQHALEDADAAVIIAAPHMGGLAAIAESQPKRVAQWLNQILSTTDRGGLRQIRNLGLALASVYAHIDADISGRVFDQLADVSGAANIVMGGEKVSLWECALFAAPAIGRCAELREMAFASAYTDADLEDATIAADEGEESGWLDTYVERLVTSGHPGHQARGLAIAALRFPNSSSERLLGLDWGTGFLGDVARWAGKNYRRAQWAYVWLQAAANATDAIDFWRFATLTEGVADRRIMRALRELEGSPWLQQYGDALRKTLTDAQESRSKKRNATLFGAKAPDRDLVAMFTES